MKLHARVTKEIEITAEQEERLRNYLDGCVEHSEIEDILDKFREGIDGGNYESGYIPGAWLVDDLGIENGVEDIDL